MKDDLHEAGFVTNDEKSVWDPCQQLDWLGIRWDSARGTVEIVDKRIAKIKSAITGISDATFIVSARKLASFTGQIISMAPVSGNISRIMTRHCVMSTLSAQQWDVGVGLDQYCIAELHFWRAKLDSFKVRDCFLSKKPQHFVYSDTSATGCGSVITVNANFYTAKLPRYFLAFLEPGYFRY